MKPFRLKCDVCGRFIKDDDLINGLAVSRMVTPDSEFTNEEFEVLCPLHVDIRTEPRSK